MKNKERKLFVILLILAVCCELYGVKVLLAGSGTAFFAVWLLLGLLCAALALGVKHSLWGRLPKPARRVICVLLCAALLFFVLVEGCIMSRFFDKGTEGLDYIIVLGAQVYEDGPSPILNCRLWVALEYLRRNPDTLCIVSGGQGYNEPFPESEGMERYLVENGIAPERILQEPDSGSTWENLSFSKKLIVDENASVGVVTNNFHVFRAVQTAKRVGIENVCGIAAYTPVGFLPNNLLREFFGVVKFCLTA
ncbi:MAG: YdcF family protein [Oscillospiraceae bacterium]|nr:YdcF family protein [Oscillospiraceae bacterium]